MKSKLEYLFLIILLLLIVIALVSFGIYILVVYGKKITDIIWNLLSLRGELK